jgi:hypothetical protein
MLFGATLNEDTLYIVLLCPYPYSILMQNFKLCLQENSEEMYSLDNDSFLNSLEAMTIQNYWTDNVKHTKL